MQLTAAREPRSELETIAYGVLVGASFCMGFSLPAGRALLLLSLLLLLAALVVTRRRPVFDSAACLGLLFIVVAICATVFGINPEQGVPKLWKLAWFIGIPVYASQVRTYRRLVQILTAFSLGTGVQAALICVSNPILAASGVRDGTSPSFTRALIDAGSITDGQLIMLGVLVTGGLLLMRARENRPRAWYWALLALQVAGLLVNFKRGSWICTVLVVGVLLSVKANWKYILALAALILLVVAIPGVRTRLADFEGELNHRRGGRMLMWRKIAPELIRRHPWGIGYRALTNRMMRKIAPRVERNRDHLHSNIAQVLVATGWLGFGLYVLWMSKAMLDAVGNAWIARDSSPPGRFGSVVLLLMLCALLASGVVEYNFGDAEIVLTYVLVMGSVAGLRGHEPEPSRTSIGRLAYPV